MRTLLLSCLLLFSSFALSAQAEYIETYDVDITVRKDRSIDVVEKLRVYAAGRQIKRGITRNLPTRRDINGESYPVRYQDIAIKRDGNKEPFLKERENDIILYIGRKSVFLQPGFYDYEISYSVPQQIVSYDSYDEIYWNAIGTSVQFPVKSATATVHLPSGAEVLQQSAYTGNFGSTLAAAEPTVSSDKSTLIYKVPAGLSPRSGLSVAVGFTPDIVRQRTAIEKGAGLLVLLLSAIGLIGYFITTWFRYGIDPPKPPATPGWKSPDDLSPASVSYIESEAYKSRALTGSIIALAVKGYIRIDMEKKKGILSNKEAYSLTKIKNSDASLPTEEKRLLDITFGGSDHVELDGEYNTKVAAASTAHKAEMHADHRAFVKEGNNLKFVALPILIIIIAILLSTALCYMLGISLSDQMRAIAVFLPVSLVGLFVYRYLIIQPTKEKLALQAEIEGFKMYLDMAEKDRLDILNPPELTPEHFEELLPYAYALGLENRWSDKFKAILDKAGYAPQWSGGRSIYYMPGFHRDFSGSVQKTATMPSADGSGGGFSGSGGGGFSGGGGGGGGVGGW